MGFPNQIWSPSTKGNYVHLKPVIDAIHSHICDLGLAQTDAVKCITSIKDLLVATVDSVCVDLSMIGERSQHYHGEYQEFRSMQHDLLLRLGQSMIKNVAMLCHAFEHGNISLVGKHVEKFVEIMGDFRNIDQVLAKKWFLPHDERELGAMMLGSYALVRKPESA